MLSTQFEISSNGVPDANPHPGALGDYAANGGQFVNAIVDNPLCCGAMCQATSQVINNQLDSSTSQTRLKNMVDGTSRVSRMKPGRSPDATRLSRGLLFLARTN